MSKDKKFKFLEHSADVYIQSYGKTLIEAFENSAIGLGFLIIESDNVESKQEREIKIKSEDKKSLLFDFLTRILYYQDAESIVFHEIEIDRIEKLGETWFLEAKLWGEEFNSEKHEQGTPVKAITYHNMEIEKSKDKYRVKVLVDI